jgi:hypothetical protein
MKTEILIYLLVSIILCSIRRVISGMKNGCFYGKGNHNYNPKLLKYINNIHYLETPAWYTQFGSLFFSIFAVFRAVNYSIAPLDIAIQFIACMLVVMGSSGIASYHFQGWINYGEGSPFYNPKEDKMSEFAFWKISFFWNRGWLDNYKKEVVVLSAFMIIVGLIIGLKIY